MIELTRQSVDEGGAGFAKMIHEWTGEVLHVLIGGDLDMMLRKENFVMSSPKDRAGPPRITPHNDEDLSDRCPFIPGGSECGSPKNVHGCHGTLEECFGYSNERNFGGTVTDAAWVKLILPVQHKEEEGRCQWEPGSKECGCMTAPFDNMLPACGGTYRECVGYGNEQNFGGIPQVVSVYEVDGKLYSDAEEALEAAAKKAFLKWYNTGDNTLHDFYKGSRIDGDKVLEWIEEHKETLAKLLEIMV